ncbi:UDP-N-acetylmuramoylalanyl-D-glutamate--2,6-diaminopimelate ligase [Fodinibius salinus]|uniref:UDP-N-acetylmuramoyl-L-alanyl-D-glutamate--2,6-diaminopimelate ligase n=1 Tax=Fodinibius salinus TaxID=860790 RepID=A0A5D3YGJ4_9BACT|nr:UDP-N-acetylmuramoyl-L-alanyl-D-glutamate--2,6-diaminopimelate ligase [Fodinibius salinus]TYP92211.1 UDP-N-acetylmuramoylalanyl-D-glutamate--2,6-diaminopimelate ligase [Fodinibius salinus]
MTYQTLISLCDPVEVSGPEPSTIGTLTQDSRTVEQGSVFIARRGVETDGHDYINDAIDAGASVIICEQSPDTEKDVCTLVVEDTRSLIGPLAQAFKDNPADKLNIIGITGTNGKTTVATLVYQTLQKMGTSPSLLGTVTKSIAGQTTESELTTADPIELAKDMSKMVKAGSDHLVMEVSSHALDQQRINGINFDVAAFTNLSHDHLDYHPDMEAYAHAKKKLFDGLSENAYAIINADDEQAAFISKDCAANIIDFSFQKALEIECQVLSNTINGLVIRIAQTMIESPLVGAFNAYNLTEAFLICHALGYEKETVADALEELHGAAGRLERIADSKSDENPVVLVDYAHTPDALKNVASTLANLKQDNKKLHIVFGCGGNRDKAKRPQMAKIANRYADKVIVTSDNPRDEKPERIIAEIMSGFEHPETVDQIVDRKEAITQSILDADAETMILIAGKGHETYQEIEGKKLDFDDREVAREALAKRNSNAKNKGE